MASPTSLGAPQISDLIRHFKITAEQLEEKCSHQHLRSLSQSRYFLWMYWVDSLGLSQEQISDIEDMPTEEANKSRKALSVWKESNGFMATYKSLVEIFLKGGNAKLAGEICKLLKEENKKECKRCTSLQSSFLEELRKELEVFRTLGPAAQSFVENAIDKYVHRFIQAGSSSSVNHLHEHLEQLHKKEKLMSTQDLQAAKQMSFEVSSFRRSSITEIEVMSPPTIEEVPTTRSFSEPVLYRASICSLGVCRCTLDDVQDFFKAQRLHALKEVSLSQSSQERYLVAMDIDSTYYIAFQSKPDVTEWPRKYKSFTEGIVSQAERFPLHFILELLTKGRVVLTGFSFGGLLACSVATQIWQSQLLSMSHLLENLVCITFAQPHIPVPQLAAVARDCPDVASTIHAIYSEDDAIPRLMKYLDQPVGFVIQRKRRQPPPPFGDSMTLRLVQEIGTFINQAMVANQPSSHGEPSYELRNLLRVFSNEKCPPQPAMTHHLLLSGSKLKEVSLSEVFEQTTFPNADRGFNIDFVKHHMEVYSELINDICQHHYVPEVLVEEVLPPVSSVCPVLTRIELHNYGSESVLAVDGSNLSFCNNLSICGVRFFVSRHLWDHSVQVELKSVSKALEKLKNGQKIEVEVQTLFTSCVAKNVPVFTKAFVTSIRQQQLARLTPAKVIELSYLSALLEQQPFEYSKPLSDKVASVRNFLEKIVAVTPIESIGYAVAYGNSYVSSRCNEAIEASSLTLSSLLMSDAMKLTSLQVPVSMPHTVSPVPTSVICGLSLDSLYPVTGSTQGLKSPINVLQHGRNRLSSLKTLDHSYSLKSLDISGEGNLIVSPPEPEQRRSSSLRSKSFKRYPSLPHRPQSLPSRPLSLPPRPLSKSLFPPSSSVLDDVSGSGKMALRPPKPEKRRAGSLKFSSSLPHRNYSLPPSLPVPSSQTRTRSLVSSRPSSSPRRPSTSSLGNSLMLRAVNGIRKQSLAVCVSLITGFIRQSVLDIPIVSTRHDRIGRERFALGVWALSSLGLDDVCKIVEEHNDKELVVRVEEFTKGLRDVSAEALVDKDYAGKVHFLVQAMQKTVSYGEHISYSLERQLVHLCQERNVTASTSFHHLIRYWDKIFEEDVLSLVPMSHRPLIARWLNWSLMIHNLREELAKSIAVGVIGLVNSGKSRLAKSLFGLQISSGSTEDKRTTVPFIYNLDEKVRGLDVVDFPGVDDRDESISELADLILTLAQIIIFVVDYRRVHTLSAKEWLERLQVEKVPFLVCLTYADKLYAEKMTRDGQHPDKNSTTAELDVQLSKIREKLELPEDKRIMFCSFSQDIDSILNCEEGRQKLRDVGIKTPLEVGDWLVETLMNRFDKEDIAIQLHQVLHSRQSHLNVHEPWYEVQLRPRMHSSPILSTIHDVVSTDAVSPLVAPPTRLPVIDQDPLVTTVKEYPLPDNPLEEIVPNEGSLLKPSRQDTESFVSLVTNDSYALGAITLGLSLRKTRTSRRLTLLTTSDVSPNMRIRLSRHWDELVLIEELNSGDAENLSILARPELGVTFSKLHAWRLTQYRKCVFLDADTIVVQNVDELFDREELSAAPDIGWPDCFNSGVFVFVPSLDTFKVLLDLANQRGSFDGGDQGLLNSYWNDWATKDIEYHLPFIYNVTPNISYGYAPAFHRFRHKIKIIHFIGRNKPWHHFYLMETDSIILSPGTDASEHATQDYTTQWWQLYSEAECEHLYSSCCDSYSSIQALIDKILNRN